MKKFELIQAVAKATGKTQEVVEDVINGMQSVIAEACVENGDDVNLPDLGRFKQKVMKARKGRNPLTGESIDIPESHTLIFKASMKLKKVIQPKKQVAKKA